MEETLQGKVALVTGGANGIGAAVARRLGARGATVVVADVDDHGAAAVADSIGGAALHLDVTELAAWLETVAHVVDRFGGLDVVHLNAGVVTGCGITDDFDAERYSRALSINVNGVVYGVHAVVPALRARGGGDIVATASLAGIVAVPFDPVYALTKHAVVGLVRSLGLILSGEGIRINALCPGFADTTMVDDAREMLAAGGVPIIPLDEVVVAFEAVLASGGNGQCWPVQAGRRSEPFVFRNAPGPRRPA